MFDPIDMVLRNGDLIGLHDGKRYVGWRVWTDYGEVDLPGAFKTASATDQRAMIDAARAKAEADYFAPED